jgi:hypothetical protein
LGWSPLADRYVRILRAHRAGTAARATPVVAGG